MKVDDIMNKRFAVISGQASIRDAAAMMRRFDVGVLPVTMAGDLVGMLSDRDIVVRGVAAGRDPEQTPVTAFMTPEVITCNLDDSVEQAVGRMAGSGVRRLVVMNLEHEISGILSVDDLAHGPAGDQALARVMRSLPAPGPQAKEGGAL
jgi:CBS domain-containing protein